jgi:hypothetical protein
MIMGRIFGLLMFVPATMFLAVSFFILVVIRRIDEKGLKTFGYVVVTLLWIGSSILFSLGAYKVITGKRLLHPIWEYRMHQMMLAPTQQQEKAMIRY